MRASNRSAKHLGEGKLVARNTLDSIVCVGFRRGFERIMNSTRLLYLVKGIGSGSTCGFHVIRHGMIQLKKKNKCKTLGRENTKVNFILYNLLQGQ